MAFINKLPQLKGLKYSKKADYQPPEPQDDGAINDLFDPTKKAKLPSLFGPDENNTLQNPFYDGEVQSTANSVGLNPSIMGGAADAGLAGGASGEYINPIAGAGEAGGMGSGMAGGLISAGSTAIATTANLVSQAVQQQAQREFGASQNDLDRQLQAKLVQMNLNESRYESNMNAKNSAYKMLLSAINNNINATLGASQNIRNSAQGFDSLLAQAFLK